MSGSRKAQAYFLFYLTLSFAPLNLALFVWNGHHWLNLLAFIACSASLLTFLVVGKPILGFPPKR